MAPIQHLVGPTTFPSTPGIDHLSLLSWNVLLPNSVDGWWNYKMYLPPLTDDQAEWATWDYRRALLRERIATVDADVVCLQEVAPVSFDDDFAFMKDLGYDGKEMFKKGRFRPATFWKTASVDLASPPVHKDRTLLTAFRPKVSTTINKVEKDKPVVKTWYVLNCHLQAGQERRRRVRQINEGVRAAMTLARKLKDRNPERNIPLIVCGDFNGGSENGAIRYLEDGLIDESFREDGEPVTSARKDLPLENPMTDVMASIDRDPPSTLVVNELISTMVEGEAFGKPRLSRGMLERLERIYGRFASQQTESGKRVMSTQDVERWLVAINKELGRGSEYREAARQMGWIDEDNERISLPRGSALSLDGFIKVYDAELQQGKFWGIAYDMAVLGEPLPQAGVFQARFDRIYCSSAVTPTAVMDFRCDRPCPNEQEASDHLPVAAAFAIRTK